MKPKPIKPVYGSFIAAFLFLVSWQEYELHIINNNCPPPEYMVYCVPPDPIYTVKTVDKSVKMKTESDVDKFLGYDWKGHSGGGSPGLIGSNAINVTMKEIGESK